MEKLYIIGGIIFIIILILIVYYFFSSKTSKKESKESQKNLKLALYAGDYINDTKDMKDINYENYMSKPVEYCKNMKKIFEEISKIYKNVMGSEYKYKWQTDCSAVSSKEDTISQFPNPEIIFEPLIEVIKRGKEGYDDLVAIYIISIVNMKTMTGWKIINNSEIEVVKNNGQISLIKIKLPTNWHDLNTFQICSPSTLISSIKDRKESINNEIIKNVKQEAEKQISYDDIKDLINDNNTEMKIDTIAKIVLYSLSKEGMFPGIN